MKIHKARVYATSTIEAERMIEFAKLHVKAAMRAITSAEYDRATERQIDSLTRENLDNFYPLTNIK